MKTIKKMFLNFDYYLFINVLLIFFIGILSIASATNYDVNGISPKLKMQIISFFIGFIIMVIIMLIDYKIYADLFWLVYILGILALLVVYIPGFGSTQFGARSWVKITSSMYFQTSEIVKIAYIVVMSKILDKYKNGMNHIKDLILPILVSFPYFFLIFIQPDLGTMLVFLFIFIGMVFEAKLSYKIIFSALLTFLILSPIAYNFLNDYQKNRISEFLNPSDMSNSAYFHRYMSEITIGSGKMKGNGLFKGRFSANKYLPVQESDFIFSVWVEDTGFIGGMILIFLYFSFMLRIIYISYKARDKIGSYMSIGILFMFIYNIFENIGMTMGVMPITGVTLPFVSYGGSSILINMIAVGLLLNISLRANLSKKNKHSC